MWFDCQKQSRNYLLQHYPFLFCYRMRMAVRIVGKDLQWLLSISRQIHLIVDLFIYKMKWIRKHILTRRYSNKVQIIYSEISDQVNKVEDEQADGNNQKDNLLNPFACKEKKKSLRKKNMEKVKILEVKYNVLRHGNSLFKNILINFHKHRKKRKRKKNQVFQIISRDKNEINLPGEKSVL